MTFYTWFLWRAEEMLISRLSIPEKQEMKQWYHNKFNTMVTMILNRLATPSMTTNLLANRIRLGFVFKNPTKDKLQWENKVGFLTRARKASNQQLMRTILIVSKVVNGRQINSHFRRSMLINGCQTDSSMKSWCIFLRYKYSFSWHY